MIYPNKLKNCDFADAEHARFDPEKTGSLLPIGTAFSESNLACSAKVKTNSSACLGIYLDNATMSSVKTCGEQVFGERFSAYGAIHGLEKVFEEEEEKLRSFFHMGKEDRYFVTSSSDDLPRAILRSSKKKKIGVFLTDSQAALQACDEARGNFEVYYLREGEKFNEGLLFLQYVHPLTGVITGIEQIEAAKENGCTVALDISYALGKIPLDPVWDLADYIMVRGAALGVPFGLSLVLSRGIALEARETSVDALQVFIECVQQAFSKELLYSTEIARIKGIFEDGERVLFSDRERAPHISCIAFPSVKNELLLFTLSRRGVFATMGGGPFPLLDRMLPSLGVPFVEAMTALSFCFGDDIQEKDVLEAKLRLRRVVKELRVISEGV